MSTTRSKGFPGACPPRQPRRTEIKGASSEWSRVCVLADGWAGGWLECARQSCLSRPPSIGLADWRQSREWPRRLPNERTAMCAVQHGVGNLKSRRFLIGFRRVLHPLWGVQPSNQWGGEAIGSRGERGLLCHASPVSVGLPRACVCALVKLPLKPTV